ncbi:PR domain zinc finger protein 5-like isoform X2 [Toxorhynchites rutilus septentrionalis]|uniref:PR domain zinc finger protein 5-like isoform X2 n=1 Tax=Toxorhynchites rutilus septentrionalis TaxID=329112 RepID=UPI00247ACBE5|nr:PR domain zinc finger protein 5-like isoform X2 [Toxorhynchites rutilus septentrionalis]
MNLGPNFDRKCRTCGTDIAQLTCGIPIFGSGLQLDQKIRRYLGLNISPYDELPKCICATCFIKIEGIDKLAILAKKTEEAYLAWFKCIRVSVSKCNSPTNNVIQRKTVPLSTTLIPYGPATNKSTISVISYSDLKLGLLIKDQELLKLILKALKWAEYDRTASFETLLQRLRNTTFRNILSNRNLLNDSDLTQLLKSYIGQETFTKIQPNVSQPLSSKSTHADSSNVNFRLDDDSVTQMEVGVDPSLFLDDEETQSKSRLGTPLRRENNITIKLIPVNLVNNSSNEKCDVRKSARYPCTNCTDFFASSLDLQQHIVAVHMSSSNLSRTENDPKTIKIRVRKQINPPRSGPISSTLNVGPEPKQITEVKSTLENTSSNTTKSSSRTKRKRARENYDTKAPTISKSKPKGCKKVRTMKDKFTCERCDRVFKTSQNLSRHRAYHDGRKFSCDRCRRAYATSNGLKTHIITHSDARPHKCALCNKSFKGNQDLKFHQNRHTRARPYQCPHCSKIFTNSDNCFRHRKRIHANIEITNTEEESQNRNAKSKSQ